MTLYVDDLAVEARIETPTRCLCRIEDGEVFAYAHGHELVRVRDQELWAVERHDTLISVRSGAALAYREGKVWFATETREPLYYERAY